MNGAGRAYRPTPSRGPGASRPALVAAQAAPGCGKAHAAAHLAVAAPLAALHFMGAIGSGAATTAASCVLLLVVGLPHGSLDLELLKRERRAGPAAMAGALLLYLALAAAMLAMWRMAPVAALGAFLLVAIAHFAEDWREVGEPFLAHGTAVALLAAPALRHRVEMGELFAALVGDPRGAVAADLLLMVAPVALCVAAVATARLWALGRRPQAVITAGTLAAMVALPPLVGFALFFCVHHSPRHLGQAFGALPASGRRWPVAAALTAAALGIAALLFVGLPRADVSARAVAACFMTLSILTVPHMMVPAMLSRWAAPAPPAQGR